MLLEMKTAIDITIQHIFKVSPDLVNHFQTKMHLLQLIETKIFIFNATERKISPTRKPVQEKIQRNSWI